MPKYVVTLYDIVWDVDEGQEAPELDKYEFEGEASDANHALSLAIDEASEETNFCVIDNKSIVSEKFDEMPKDKPKFKPYAFTLKKLMIDIENMMPTASLEYDNHGQIVIYTGMIADDDGVLWKYDGPPDEGESEG